MRIWTSQYQLLPHKSLNSRSSGEPRKGSLLRYEFENSQTGYADLHPWVELGDEPLSEQLQRLKLGRLTALTERSLAMARADANARARGVSLFENLAIPRSHFLLTALDDGAIQELNQARARIFSTVKIKIGRDLAAEAEWLVDHQDLLSDFNLRLDANAKTGLIQIEDFLDRLPETIIKSIQFIEDPCVFHPVAWAQVAARVPVAFDRAIRLTSAVDEKTGEDLDPATRLIRAGVTHLIWKPASQNRDEILNLASQAQLQIVATSYLDHPIGQLGAAYEVGCLRSMLREQFESRAIAAPGISDVGTREQEAVSVSNVCGLLSQTAYQSNEFTDEWQIGDGPEFRTPPGTGIGFDELLESRNWDEL